MVTGGRCRGHPSDSEVATSAFRGAQLPWQIIYGTPLQRKRAQCQAAQKSVSVRPIDIGHGHANYGDKRVRLCGHGALAFSVAVAIGEAQKTFRDASRDASFELRVGNGLE